MFRPSLSTFLILLVLAGCSASTEDAVTTEKADNNPPSDEAAEIREDPPEAAEEQPVASGEPPRGRTVKTRLSRQLSPQAKKLVLRGETDTVRALLQVAPNADLETLRADLVQHGAEVSSWMEETRLLTIEVKASQLQSVVELPGVVYVDTATRYRY